MRQKKLQKNFNQFFKKNLKNKKIAVTGSKGFISKQLIQELKSLKVSKLKIKELNSNNVNYFNYKNLEKKLKSIDYVIHLSSATGGIKYTKENMSEQFYITMMKDLNVFKAAEKNKVKKLVTLGNLHAYPKNINGKLTENKIYGDLPFPGHLGIGWSKRNLSVMGEIFSKNNKSTNFITLYSANCYGPGDTLDLNYGHIIPKLIIQCLKNKNFNLFGSLNAVREFIYVKDLVNIIILSLIRINKTSFFNIGSGEKVKISELVNIIKRKTFFNKKIKNKNKINDSSKRYCGNKNLYKNLNYKIIFNLDKGLDQTIRWYKNFF
tara:strand:- start:460 stop:1422 length:963 start_codon:yes stop_codon:yes gene_type:complete